MGGVGRYEVSGGRGKGRTKREAELNTNRHDPCGHTRKTTQRLINSHEREKDKGRDEHRGKERVEHWGREQHREHGTATKCTISLYRFACQGIL